MWGKLDGIHEQKHQFIAVQLNEKHRNNMSALQVVALGYC